MTHTAEMEPTTTDPDRKAFNLLRDVTHLARPFNPGNPADELFLPAGGINLVLSQDGKEAADGLRETLDRARVVARGLAFDSALGLRVGSLFTVAAAALEDALSFHLEDNRPDGEVVAAVSALLEWELQGAQEAV